MNNDQRALYLNLLNDAVESALKACVPGALRWNYETGLVLGAIKRASGKYFAHRYDGLVAELVDSLVAPDGSIHGYLKEEYNLDQINSGKVVFDVWKDSGDARYGAAVESLMNQLATQPRTDSGAFWHKKIYPYQVWLDGLYMFGPFYARYAAEFSRPELFRDLCGQLLHVRDTMKDSATGLYYHAWDESRRQRWSNPGSGLSPHIWGRAVGWLSMALIDILDWLPADHAARPEIEEMFCDLMSSAAAAQDGSGLWFQILDMPTRAGNYLEESVSSMFIYSMYKGMGKGILGSETGSTVGTARSAAIGEEGFSAAADRALAGLVARFVSKDETGRLHVNGICKVAGLGGNPYRDGSFAYYMSEPIVSDDFKGSGPFILALCEALGEGLAR
ncbi:MAG TPA: glycoside hydrolase family 88 protein [Rectinemataceae bacterium]|nr:glycoside hydrolase family 88 protein [Rectinemataceae bacterium]